MKAVAVTQTTVAIGEECPSELQGVGTTNHREVRRQGLSRQFDVPGGRRTLDIVDDAIPKTCPGFRLHTRKVQLLASQSVAKRAYEVAGEQAVVPQCHSAAGVGGLRVRGQPGKLGNASDAVVLVVETQEHAVRTLLIQIPVRLRDEGVPAQGCRSREPVSSRVETVSDSGVVRFRKGSEVFERGGTGTGPERIDPGADECRIECLYHPVNASVPNEPIAHGSRRNPAHRAAVAGVPPSFVVEEVEDAVLLDGTADRTSEHVPDELGAIHAGPVVEEIIGGGDGVAVVFVERPVDFVGPALGHQRHLGAR